MRFIAEVELEKPLSTYEEMVLRSWRTLAMGRQGGGLSGGTLAYSEIVFYLEDAWGMERGPMRDKTIRLIYHTDAKYREAIQDWQEAKRN